MATTASARPYKDFFMPFLHRNFAHASLCTVLVCYGIAVWWADWSSCKWLPFITEEQCSKPIAFLWSWFPLGFAGIRTGLLFIPALSVYLIRISFWHAGERTTVSPSNTLWQYGINKRTFVTIGVYMFSALLFWVFFLFSHAHRSGLWFTVEGRLHERIKLNERPIFLLFMFIVLAVVQAGVHMYSDYDHVKVSAGKAKSEQKDPRVALMDAALEMARNALTYTVVAFVFGIITYFLIGRYLTWNWVYYPFAKRFVSLAKTSRPTGLAPFLPLVGLYIWHGTLLVFLWQVTNRAFSLFLAQEPVKKGKPLTSDSKDPNGSLINGLKSRKPTTQDAAFWELAIITSRFEDRRKAIFSETNRDKGATHEQIAKVCLAELDGVVKRTSNQTSSTALTTTPAPQAAPLSQSTLRLTQPIKQAQILGPGEVPRTRMEVVGQAIGEIARTHSSPQNAEEAYGRKLLKSSQQKITDGVQQVEATVQTNKGWFASSWFGSLFRQTLRRRANNVIFGTPYSRQALITNAVIALTQLTVHSLKEDDVGQWQNLVPEIIRSFTTAIKSIEAYMQGLQVHWSDVDTLKKPPAEQKKVAEVDEFVKELKDGLSAQLGAFVEYLESMGMSRVEIQEAKKVVASKTPEMRQAR